jgi:transcription elongation factor Elf1
MSDIVKKEVCKCENCGNEAEMVVTCSLPDVETKNDASSGTDSGQETVSEKRVKGTATCTNCGNEADMWIDI